MRGTRAAFAVVLSIVRIIPADAGNTSDAGRRYRTRWDHPRGCGEHDCSAHPTRVTAGSSPRMRGTQVKNLTLDFWQRIIPADAGNTGAPANTRAYSGDHPRGCGEHMVWRVLGSRASGSSPRMRGTRNLINLHIRSLGIIPADAGNTGSG